MSKLLVKSKNVVDGLRQQITPESASWEYVGFELLHLSEGKIYSISTETTEVCFVWSQVMRHLMWMEKNFLV